MRTRERSTPANLLALSCAVFLTALFALGNARAADDHLPAKAKTVASQFEAFKKTASPQAVEAKRQQVVAYLGKLLKIEAADANLDGALAVKALITKLSAKPTTKPATGSGAIAKPSTHRKGAEKISVSPNASPTRFSINRESKRTLAFDFEVPVTPVVKTIRLEVGGASDDSGDQGLHFVLIDPAGKVVEKGFLTSREEVKLFHQTGTSGGWQLQIQDKDTTFDGAHPGNNGTVRVTIIDRKLPQGTAVASH